MMNVRALAVALAAVLFAPVAAPAAGAAGQPRLEKVVLAGGCLRSAVVGYSGGSKLTAHYEIVSTGATGHAESVELTFDPAQISYAKILQVYFTVAHDPTELDRQGPDAGHQYRSEIYYTTDEQKKIAVDIQKEAYDQVIYIPLGQFFGPSAWRTSLTGVLDGPATPVFWNIDKSE